MNAAGVGSVADRMSRTNALPAAVASRFVSVSIQWSCWLAESRTAQWRVILSSVASASMRSMCVPFSACDRGSVDVQLCHAEHMMADVLPCGVWVAC
jgi:hypothetical protein